MGERIPAVSVVIPSFNRPALTARALRSVQAQSFEDWEAVVVDDGSEVPLAEALAELVGSDARIRVLRHPGNRGGSAARNTGVRAARGAVVSLLDSDDEWCADKLALEQQWIAHQAPAQPWVLAGRVRVKAGDHVRDSHRAPASPLPDVGVWLFVERGSLQTSALTMPRTLLTACPFDESLPRLQDWDLVLRLAMAGAHFHVLDAVTAIHHADPATDRISHRLDPAYLRRWVEARRAWMSPAAWRGFLAGKVAPELAQTGQRREAAWLLARGLAQGALPPRLALLESARVVLGPVAFGAAVRGVRRLRRGGRG
jgi:glycosyltransferase involved in cell wall biosynthesis